ncbi:hypothetical protein HDV00_007107 [Rhizophlyctis rosea]|nr:hypothetical protein HDV00_007107 [Rhizophlyctis rosea]
MMRMQTVRSNIDRFGIEQIALRRLRFVIENNEAEPCHLAMIDLVEQGHVPPTLIRQFFGPKISTLSTVRVLLLQSIDRTRKKRERAKLQQSLALARNRRERGLDDFGYGIEWGGEWDEGDGGRVGVQQQEEDGDVGRTPMRIFTPRVEATTPDAVLTVLRKVDRANEASAARGEGRVRSARTRSGRRKKRGCAAGGVGWVRWGWTWWGLRTTWGGRGGGWGGAGSGEVGEGRLGSGRREEEKDPSVLVSGTKIMKMVEKRRAKHLYL